MTKLNLKPDCESHSLATRSSSYCNSGNGTTTTSRCRPMVSLLGSTPAMIVSFNPVAGLRRAALLWRVLDVLVANGVRIELAETHRAGHAEALSCEAVSRGAT